MSSKPKYLKGTVKKVFSGDTFVVLGPIGENGYPKEKRVSIYGVRGPFKVDEDKEDPWKFTATEYLRKLIAGKTVKFASVEIEGRTFAHVLLEDGSDLAVDLLVNGYAMISRKLDPNFKPAGFDRYESIFRDAKADKIGIHSNTTPVLPTVVSFKTPKETIDKWGDKTIHGYITNITNEFRFEIFVEEFHNTIVAELRGIYIPVFNGATAKAVKSFIYKNHFSVDMNFKLVTQIGGVLMFVEMVHRNSLTYKLISNGHAKLAKDADTVLPAATYEQLKAWETEAQQGAKGLWKS